MRNILRMSAGKYCTGGDTDDRVNCSRVDDIQLRAASANLICQQQFSISTGRALL